MMPVISKLYCSSSKNVLTVRQRPHVVNGGGFVVIDYNQKVVFRVDGCGVLGKKEEMILRDVDGIDVLLIRKKGGIVEALSLSRKWKGYSTSAFEGSENLVFILKVPNNSCLLVNNSITVEPKGQGQGQGSHYHFTVKGDFPARDCSIVDSAGNAIAKVEIGEMMAGKDLYHVVVKPGIDQAFVFGVIAVLDYIYDGSTRC